MEVECGNQSEVCLEVYMLEVYMYVNSILELEGVWSKYAK